MSQDGERIEPLASQPGEVVRRVLGRLPEPDRLPTLAYLEQQAKSRADLEALRECRAYRATLGA